MATVCKDGVFQIENGCWGYRFSIVIDGRRVAKKKTTDAAGNKLKTQFQATKAREAAIRAAYIESQRKTLPPSRRTVKEVYLEYCQSGRKDRAFSTVRKQECLWQNHIGPRFGQRYVDEISVAEVTDYLKELYFDNNLSYMY
ncbi:MAG: hypothetical protein IJD98_01050, partial [Oscillospiraceae bacterium]|nr:hypothetical protein [Oscillospiraceae bacterium]